MVKHLTGFLAALLLLAAACPAQALQEIEQGAEGKTHAARISRTEITRLAVDKGRIASLSFPDGALIVERNDDQGYALIRAKNDQPVSLFLTSESGSTYALRLSPADIPMETILIREGESKVSKETRAKNTLVGKTEPISQSVKRLVLLMARGERDGREYAVTTLNQPVDLWQEAQFVLVDAYKGPVLTGYRFGLKNVSGQLMRLGEQEFWKTGVVAVAIDKHVLASGEDTEIYIVMVNSDG